MKTFSCLLPLLFCFASTIFCAEGNTFPIQEEPFRPSFKAEKALDYNKIAESAKTPTPVPGLQASTSYHSFLFDPTYTVEQDIEDIKGQKIAKKGDKINPLQKGIPLQDLLLFDGTDPDHLAWAHTEPSATWILVKGSPIEVEQATKHPTYFDQNGAICKRFGIRHVPAKLSKQGTNILIEEIPVEGGISCKK